MYGICHAIVAVDSVSELEEIQLLFVFLTLTFQLILGSKFLLKNKYG